MKIKAIMRTPITINQNSTLREAVTLLVGSRISGAPVVDDNGDLVGIMTEHDLIEEFMPTYAEIASADASLLDPYLMESKVLKVRDNPVISIMNKNVITLTEDDTVLKAATTMMIKKIKSIPIVEEGKPIGVISRIDVVEAMIRGGCTDELCE